MKALIAGNWKMNGTIGEARALVKGITAGAVDVTPKAELLVIPSFTALAEVSDLLRDTGAPVALGAQNLHWAERGAFTGEISGGMLRDIGCTHVLVGHSERRTIFGERGDVLLKKLQAALLAGLTPILCIGENLEERENGRTVAVLDEQLDETLFRIAPDYPERVVLAYEPVWAIGTGRNATHGQVAEAHHHIRSRVEASRGPGTAAGVRILYGGSVNGRNAAELLCCPGVDGALVGGASLMAEEFLKIARAAPDGLSRGLD